MPARDRRRARQHERIMTEPVPAHYLRLNAERRLGRLSPQTLRAAGWALAAVVRARRNLRTQGLAARVPPPPSLPWGSRTGVLGVLNRLSPTCLERALVLQAWLSAHDVAADVVVGVARDSDGTVRAHAWLDGITNPSEFARYTPIHRIEAL